MSTLNATRRRSRFALLLAGLLIALSCGAVRAADDEDTTLSRAREAMNQARYQEAAELYARLFELQRGRAEAGNALYWEAFARYRLEQTVELKQAARLLELQREDYRDSETAEEAEALAARIYGELAQRGEADASRLIRERAQNDDVRQETRAAALQALMQMDSERALPILKKIVSDPKPENRDLRRNAVFILCQQGGEGAEDLLLQMLQTETDSEFLSELVMCLSMMGSDRSLQALMDLFDRTDDEHVAEATLISIGQRGGDEVFAFLEKIARDPARDHDTRGRAMMALGMTGRDETVAPLLVEILETEKDPRMLEMAMVGLSNLDSELAGRALLKLALNENTPDDLRAHALYMASSNDELSVAELLKIYEQTGSRELKQQICHLLTTVDDEEAALTALLKIARQEKDSQIRRDVVFWIGQFDDDRAAEFLLEIINEK